MTLPTWLSNQPWHSLIDFLISAVLLGEADVMVAGGSEAAINEITLAGFCRMKALCTSRSLPNQP